MLVLFCLVLEHRWVIRLFNVTCISSFLSFNLHVHIAVHVYELVNDVLIFPTLHACASIF